MEKEVVSKEEVKEQQGKRLAEYAKALKESREETQDEE